MSDNKFRAVRLGNLIPELIEANEATIEARRIGKPPGPTSNFARFDEILGGCFAPGLHILQSAPGDGKSALALQIAATCGFPAIYLTAEQPLIELFRRLIARTTNTFLVKIKKGEIDSKTLTRLAQTTAEKNPWLILLDSLTGYAGINDIYTMASALLEQAKQCSCLIVIDSLQYWSRMAGSDPTIRGINDYDLINTSLTALAKLANQLSVPIIAISHRNRQGNKGDGGLFSSKGSGDVEYIAESVLELTRKQLSSDPGGKTVCTLSIWKNRHGESGQTIELDFLGRIQQFMEKVK